MFTCFLATVFRTAWEMRLVLERIIFLLLLIKMWVMVGVLIFTIAYYFVTGMMCV